MNDNGAITRRLYKKFYISTVITVFLRNSAYFISSFLAGNLLGPAALGTVGLLVPFSFFYIALGTLYEIGCAALCSKYIGDNDFDGAKKIVTAAYVSNLVICAAIAALGFLFLNDILYALKIPAETFAEARVYASVFMVCGFFISSVSIGYALLKFDGYLKALTIVTAISPLSALTITYALISRAGAGLSAIAAGTCAGYVVIGLIILYLTANKAKVLGFVRVRPGELSRICMKIVKNGLTGATGEICSIVNGVVINTLLITNYGQLALSCFTAYCALFSLYAASTLGSSLAFVQLAGVMNAERDSTGVERVVYTSLAWGLSLAVVVSVGNLYFTGPISAGFGLGSPEAAAVMRPVMLALSICAVFDVFTNTFIFLYNTLGRHMASTMLVAGRRMGFLLLPAFVLSDLMGVTGVWHSLWLCSALTSAAAIIYSSIAARRNPYLTKPFLIDTEAERKGNFISFSVNNDAEDVVNRLENIASFCRHNRIDRARTDLIALTIEEMLSLIRDHSPKGRAGTISVRLLFYKDDAVIRIRSDGEMFNPSEKLTPGDALNRRVKNTDYRQIFGVNNLTITI